MSCDQFEQRLNDALDERRDPRLIPEIVAHASRCRACRRVLQAQTQVLNLLASTESLPGDESLFGARYAEPALTPENEIAGGSRVELAGRPRRTAPRPAGWKRWSALASPLVVVVAMAGMMWRAGEQVGEKALQPVRPVHERVSRGVRGGPGALALGMPRTRPAFSRQVVEGRMPVGGAVREREELLPQLAQEQLRETWLQWRDSINSLPPPARDGVAQWAQGIQPVANSVGSFVEAVRQSVWRSDDEQPESSLDTSWVVCVEWVG